MAYFLGKFPKRNESNKGEKSKFFSREMCSPECSCKVRDNLDTDRFFSRSQQATLTPFCIELDICNKFLI